MPASIKEAMDAKRQAIESRLSALDADQEERLARRRAQALRLPYISLVAFPVDPSTLAAIPRVDAEAAGAVLFYKRGNDVRIGAINPGQAVFTNLVRQVVKQFGVQPQVYVISHHSFKLALSRYMEDSSVRKVDKGKLVISRQQRGKFREAIANLHNLGERIATVSMADILSVIMSGAIQLRASDIHVEPRSDMVRLRYRIDGVLQDVTTFARNGWQRILSRVKVLAELKLNVHDLPQEGSFVLHVDSELYDVRVSVLPGGWGEYIVLRMLSRRSSIMQLSELGMKEWDQKLVEEELKQSTGMVLSAGPTGSGKTTTIAACLALVNRPELKVITLEDPIEYRLEGIEQTEVDAESGYTFGVGLRSILRQDPDIIFVGEMRDTETAETAVHAAMTGHLVFSTMHTNDAPGVIVRLIDIGIKPNVLAPALNLVIAQRLVRVVCTACAEEYVVDNAMREHIAEVMRGVTAKVFSPDVLRDTKLTFLRAKGCEKCGGSGYRGRTGVFELFVVTGKVEELILRGADGNTIQEAAVKAGMTTILQDAYLKVLDRVTTVEEVERVTKE